MKKFSLFLLMLSLYFSVRAQLPAARAVGEKLTIGFNKNVEFLGFMYFITYEGTNIETNMLEIDGKQVPEKLWQAYGYQFYQRYKKHAASPYAARAMGIAENLWLSQILPLLLQVEDFPNARLTPFISEGYYLPFSKDRNKEQGRKNAEAFLSACNELYREAGFDGYLSSSSAYYLSAIRQLGESIPGPGFIRASEKLYRKRFESYQLVPSLTLPKGMGFGPSIETAEGNRVYSIFGAVDFQQLSTGSKLDMGFGDADKVREMGIHEFGHSFVNPDIEHVAAGRIRSTSPLFGPLRSKMEAQGYNNWMACLTEHFVRAGEILIAEKMDNGQSARRLLAAYAGQRSFIYLPVILGELRKFSADPLDTFPRAVERVMLLLEQKAAAAGP